MALPMPLGVTAVMLPELELEEQIALCKRAGVTHYCVRPRVIPESQVGKPWGNWGNHKFDLTPQRLVKEGAEIKKKIEDAGMSVFGSVPTGTIDLAEDEMKLNFEGAAIVGAGRLRMQPQGYPQEHFDYPSFLQQQIDGFGKAIELAKPFGVKIVIETHCRSFATSPALALALCQSFSPDEIGAILDIANFNIEGFVQPNLAVAILDKYIDHAHVGGSRLHDGEYDELGFRKSQTRMCTVTDANVHIPSWINALHAAGRDVPLIIEDYTPNKTGELRLSEAAAALRRVLETL